MAVKEKIRELFTAGTEWTVLELIEKLAVSKQMVHIAHMKCTL
ncbi:MAG: hypothetical protein ACK4S0_08920 [Sediminibacterium sp.]